MLGTEPNFYWTFCFKILTPIFTIVSIKLHTFKVNHESYTISLTDSRGHFGGGECRDKAKRL